MRALRCLLLGLASLASACSGPLQIEEFAPGEPLAPEAPIIYFVNGLPDSTYEVLAVLSADTQAFENLAECETFLADYARSIGGNGVAVVFGPEEAPDLVGGFPSSHRGLLGESDPLTTINDARYHPNRFRSALIIAY